MSTLNVLLVDDSAATRRLITVLLEKAGHHLRTAGDGKQALAMLSDFHPDLILMDFLLPGISGPELTEHLRSDPAMRGTVIIAFTACTLASDINRALAAGCDAFIAKPINPRTFVSQVESVWTQKRRPENQPSVR